MMETILTIVLHPKQHFYAHVSCNRSYFFANSVEVKNLNTTRCKTVVGVFCSNSFGPLVNLAWPLRPSTQETTQDAGRLYTHTRVRPVDILQIY